MASPLAPAAASAIAPPVGEAERTARPWYLQASPLATAGKGYPRRCYTARVEPEDASHAAGPSAARPLFILGVIDSHTTQ